MCVRARVIGVIGIMVVAVALGSCGTLKTDTTSLLPQTGTGALPGVVGTIGGGGVSSSDIPPVTNITNGNSSAPLGTNPEYNVQQGGAVITPVDTSHSGSKVASNLAPGQLFKLNRITLAPKGQQPNWSTTSFIFNEGDTVDFYAEYEIAGGTQYTRKWEMDSCGLNYAEPMDTAPATGTYLAMFRYTLPYGSASDNAAFNFEAFYGNRSTSSITKQTDVVVGGGDGPTFNIIDLTMMPDGVAPDWTLSHQQYIEGQAADLWIKYEMLAPTMNINRHWYSPDIDLDQTEFGVTTPKGVYEIKLDWTIPNGSVKNNAVFQYDLTNGTIHKYSEPFYFDIVSGSGGGTTTTYSSQTSVFNYTSTDPGIFCGHLDIDTSHLVYPPAKGTTDGHIHEWDDKFNSIYVNYFDMKTTTLHNIQRDIAATQKFKIIVANADLSPGARLVINKNYDENDPSTYVLVTQYDDIPIANLPVYSLSGVAGTTKLDKLEMHYLTTAIQNRQVIPTNTGDVRGNILGKNGETRNGALTLQAVKVNSDGTDGFTTKLSYSAGGVQGGALSGLAWESTTFWHWGGPSYHQSGWSTYDYTKDFTCTGSLTEPTVLASGGGNFRVLADTSLTKTYYPGTSGVSAVSFPVARMFWEDLQNSGDYDYNEFVGDLQATEWRTSSGAVKQVKLYLKALARGASDNTKAWQFNLDGAFPGTGAVAKVDQYYDNADGDLTNDQAHVYQSFWTSQNGVNVPIFVTTRDALPKPADSSATTNTVSNTTFVEGDYATVTITFDTPVAAGTYTPAPYNPELRVQQGTTSAYIYHLWRHKGDALLTNGYPAGGFIVPATPTWMLETKSIDTGYSGWAKWVKWLGTAATDNPADPNTYMLPSPMTGASVFGDPQTKAYWTGGTGGTDFHTQQTGQMDTLTLLKYLNGDATVTNQSISKEVLNPCKSSKSYDTHLPLRLTNVKPTSSDGYNDFKTYVTNGVSTTKPLEYQLGTQLIMLVMNVERGHVQPNEWVWCPEVNEIRPIVTDQSHMPGRLGLIAEANAAFALPNNAASDAIRQKWLTILTRVNNNANIIQQQYWPEPSPAWYNQAPVANYYQRSLFKP